MTNLIIRSNCSVSCPVHSAKAVVSFAYRNAARFFSALRFYFFYFYFFVSENDSSESLTTLN